MLWKGSPGEANCSCQILASPLAHSGREQQHHRTSLPLHKPHCGMLCQPPAGYTIALPTGNLFCKACGSMETQKQESRSPTRKRLLLLVKCYCFLCDPTLSVYNRLAVVGTQRCVQESPTNSPRDSSHRGIYLLSLAKRCSA